MKKKRLLITGSTGFIARNIIETLKSKYDLIYPDRKELDLLNTINVEQFFKNGGIFDLVIHCAFIGGPRKFKDTPQTFMDNSIIFFNLIRNNTYFKRLINLGSGAEYGKQESLKNVTENKFDKLLPETADYYGFCKYMIAKYIERSDNFINLRLFGVYGKYEDLTLRFISNSICKSILNMPIIINKNVYFDYLYIKDFIKILDYFINHKPIYKSYNVGRGKPIDLITITNKINKIATKKSPIKILSKGFANEYTCSNRRLLKELGSFRFTEFDESFKELYLWYSETKGKWRKEITE